MTRYVVILIALCFFASCNTTFMGARKVSLGNDAINLNDEHIAMVQNIREAWESYMQYAKGYDLLLPLSKTGSNTGSNSLLETPFAAYQTLKMAGLENESQQCAALIKSQFSIDLNENFSHYYLTSHILGGLLSIYAATKDEYFLQQAIALGDKLMSVFKSPFGVPYGLINLHTGEVSGDNVSLEQAAGFLPEYSLLSRFSNNPKYIQAAEKAAMAVLKLKSKSGLLGTSLSIRNGLWSNPECQVGGANAGFYRSLFTYGFMTQNPALSKEITDLMNANSRYLSETTNTGLWYEVASMSIGTQVNAYFPINASYYPGLLAKYGKINEADKLFESVLRLWFEYGIGLDELDYKTFQVLGASYLLSGEPIESALMLYKLTGNDRPLRAGLSMIHSVEKFCKNEQSFAALKDVRILEKMDVCGSNLYSQTLKFALLLTESDTRLFDVHQQIITNGGYIFDK